MTLLWVLLPNVASGATHVTAPGQEQVVSALVAQPDEWRHRWRIGDTRIEQHALVVTLAHGAERASIDLRHVSQTPGPAPFAEADRVTRWFSLTYRGAIWQHASPELRDATVALTQLIIARERQLDLSALWRKVADRPREDGSSSSPKYQPRDGEARPADEVSSPDDGYTEEEPWWTLATGPSVWLSVLLAWLLFFVRDRLRRAEGPAMRWLLVALAIGVAWRVWLSPSIPATAWSWGRQSPLALMLSGDRIAALLADQLPGILWFDDLVYRTHLVLACLTPVALFAHAAGLFKDIRTAVIASALLALSPHHIRFAATDALFIPSLFLSSGAFAAVYAAATATRRRSLALIALAAFVWLALGARPLNVLFIPLLFMSIWMATDGELSRRTAPLWLCVLVPGVARVVDLLTHQMDSVSDGLVWSTLSNGLTVFFRPDYNPLLAWALTPPVWTPLILWGGWLVYRQSPKRAGFLVAWLCGFIVAHGVVVPRNPAMNARYQLHALVPMALLAAPAARRFVELLWARGPAARSAAVGFVALLILSPWLHRPAIEDDSAFVQQERQFYDQLRTFAPHECSVIERFRPVEAVMATPRAPRVSSHVSTAGLSWASIPLSVETKEAIAADSLGAGGPSAVQSRWTTAQGRNKRRFAEAPARWNPHVDDALRSGCAIFMEGIECSRNPTGPERDPLCARVLATGKWRLVAERRFPMKAWDTNYASHLRRDGQPVVLRMWRYLGEGDQSGRHP
ncbi:MAG: hypothetical protein KC502_07335 [Myxococcales bacterium]|nr:hypothetical protein [Myxococcales bacterium]